MDLTTSSTGQDVLYKEEMKGLRVFKAKIYHNCKFVWYKIDFLKPVFVILILNSI